MVASMTRTASPDLQSLLPTTIIDTISNVAHLAGPCACRWRSDLHAACTAIEEFPDLMKLHVQQVHSRTLSLPAGSILYRGSAAQRSFPKLS